MHSSPISCSLIMIHWGNPECNSSLRQFCNCHIMPHQKITFSSENLAIQLKLEAPAQNPKKVATTIQLLIFWSTFFKLWKLLCHQLKTFHISSHRSEKMSTTSPMSKKTGIVILPGNTELSPVVFLSMRRGVLTMFDSSHSTQKIWAANVRKGAIGEYSIQIISL